MGAGCASRAARPQLELADLFRTHLDRLGPLTSPQAHAVRAILDCRTAALGGHVFQCDRCGHREISYNSCRNRHCPKCQGLEKARWIEARRADLLPVQYHHVVFTIPQELHPIFRLHPKAALDLLFKAVSQTLQDVARNPTFLGARIGFTAVLHTWTQKVLYHPHVHCIVPGGGLSPTGDRWISAPRNFFLPVRALSKVFRGKLLSMLESAGLRGQLMELSTPEILALLARASLKKWVVYSKPPVAGPDQVLDYLGRYTHRIAISNDRLVHRDDDRITLRWKDRAQGDRKRLLTLEVTEFLRRFLLHVLPKGLVRLRHYGFLANAIRRQEIARCRDLLGVAPTPVPGEVLVESQKESWQELLLRLTGRDVTRCPECGRGCLREVEILERSGAGRRLLGSGTTS